MVNHKPKQVIKIAFICSYQQFTKNFVSIEQIRKFFDF